MLAIITLSFLLVVLYLIFAFYWKPKAQLRRMTKQLTELGYNVYAYPFNFWPPPFIMAEQKGIKEHNDSKYH